MENHFFAVLKKYGIVGVILAYFLYQDNNSRELDRQDRKNNIRMMETLADKIGDLNTRITVLEIRLDKLTDNK
ncbi:MAG: hypothetical protein ACRCX2_16350 [Paraclostridium sp.]